MSNKPDWFPQARELCRAAGIEIAAWGSDTLVVYAKSPDRVSQVASQLASLGLQPVPDEDDSRAGLLTLSRNPDATLAAVRRHLPRYTDFSRRPLLDRLYPVFEAAFALLLLWLGATHPSPRAWTALVLSILFLLLFFWDATRVWGWKLSILPGELRIRRNFRWLAVPWADIDGVELTAGTGRNQEAVILKLTSGRPLRLGSFASPFARALRDYLREQAQSVRSRSA